MIGGPREEIYPYHGQIGYQVGGRRPGNRENLLDRVRRLLHIGYPYNSRAAAPQVQSARHTCAYGKVYFK